MPEKKTEHEPEKQKETKRESGVEISEEFPRESEQIFL